MVMAGLTNDKAQSLVYAMINLTNEVNRLNRNLEKRAIQEGKGISIQAKDRVSAQDVLSQIENILKGENNVCK